MRLQLTFEAEVGGPLDLDATWFVAPDWPGPMVLGWKGCLERIRFALDPTQEWFYFAQP